MMEMDNNGSSARPNTSFVIAAAFLAIGVYMALKGDLRASALIICMGIYIALIALAARDPVHKKLLKLIASILLLFVPIIISLYTDNTIVKLVLYGLMLAWAIFIVYSLTGSSLKRTRRNK
jgi:putative effector of murein hydrolase LrgA (UPF0299 family)